MIGTPAARCPRGSAARPRRRARASAAPRAPWPAAPSASWCRTAPCRRPCAAQVLDQRARIARDRVGRGVDVDVRVLGRDRDHLVGPRIADVPADDHEFGKVDRHLVEVRNRPPVLRRHQRPGVTDLRAERHAEFAAFGVDRIKARVRRRQFPEPRQHAHGLEAEFAHAPAQFAHRVARPRDVDASRRRRADPAPGARTRRPRRSRSGRRCGPTQALIRLRRDPARVHRLERHLAPATRVGRRRRPAAGPRVQRRSDSNIGWFRWRGVGCCAQASMTLRARAVPFGYFPSTVNASNTLPGRWK